MKSLGFAGNFCYLKWGMRKKTRFRGILLCFFVFLFFSFTVKGSASLYMTATPSKTALPGEIVTHVFTVTNAGTEDEIYFLSYNVPNGWNFFPYKETLFVAAGESSYVFVNLFVPEGAPAGLYEIFLTAVSSSDPAVRYTATTGVEVLPSRDLSLRWVDPPVSFQVGGEATWYLEVVNKGNVPDVYLLELEHFGDWEVKIEPREVQLLPGEKYAVTLTAVVSPHAQPGAGYSLRVIVSSIYEPTILETVTLSGHFLPPPPELVPRSLYPTWNLNFSLRTSSTEAPVWSFSGSGDIEFFDLHVDATLEVEMAGPSEPEISVIGKGKSFYLHGGTISGVFFGISGKPLLGGEIEGLGRWRLLFAKEAKGLSFTIQDNNVSLMLSTAWSREPSLSFTDVMVNWDMDETISVWGTLSQAADLEGSGYTWRCGIEISDEEWRLSSAYLKSSYGYPRRSPTIDITLEWDSSANLLPLSLSYNFSSVEREDLSSQILSHEVHGSLSLNGPLRPRLLLGYARRFDTSAPRTVDERSFSSRISFSDEGKALWNLSFLFSRKEEFALGVTALDLGASGRVKIDLKDFELTMEVGASVSMVDGIPLYSSSSTLRARLSSVLGVPSISLSISRERTSFSFTVRNLPAGEGEGDFTLTYVLEGGRSTWDATFSLSFVADFPFLGPSRGRVSGRVFIDRDGDGVFGAADEGIEGVILEANGVQAISGDHGFFLFPPLLPGKYTVSLAESVSQFIPAKDFPTVEVEPGKEITVEIPLLPRAWLRVVVFQDNDRDGKIGHNELGIPGAVIYVSGPVAGKAVTNELGVASLELPPGRYVVRLSEGSLPERYVLTTPVEVEVEVPEYGVAEVSFGAYRKPKPVVVTFAPPQAVISFTPERPRVGEPVEFDGTGSKAFGAVVTEYRWEFRLGDLRLTASGPTVTVSFPDPGDWTAILIVVDSQGRMGAARVTVSVSP